MENLIREIPLDNGLTIRFFNHTRLYYGDFYLVGLEIVCAAPLHKEYFSDAASFAEARQILGDAAVYRKFVEQQGVPSTEIERVQERLIANFVTHSLPYFAGSSFPGKLVLAEYDKTRNKVGRKSV